MTKHNPQEARPKGKTPIAAARQQSILSLVERGHVITVGAFAERFDVSQETIRRDIKALEEAGKLRRVHGGAAPMRTIDLTARLSVSERLFVDRDAKGLAAHAAIPLFESNMSVFLGASSTTLLVATELARKTIPLTVTTNMVDIAMTLAESENFHVTLLGGVVNANTRALGGMEVIHALEKRIFDLAVFGASGVNEVHGMLGPTANHTVFGEVIRERAHRVAYVVDVGKFGRSDAHIVLPLSKVDVVATNATPSDEYLRAINKAGTALMLPAASPDLDLASG